MRTPLRLSLPRRADRSPGRSARPALALAAALTLLPLLTLLTLLAPGCGVEAPIGRTGGAVRDLSISFGEGGGGANEFDIPDMAMERDRDASCGQVSAEATLVRKPIDIIVIVDNSGSMTEEIQAVERNINVNFAGILKASGLDWRFLLMAKHGLASPNESICIEKPLSGNPTCTPPPLYPVLTKSFFHYDKDIESTDSLKLFIQRWNEPGPLVNGVNVPKTGFKDWVRKDSVKIFIEITDDNSSQMTADAFETALFALQPAVFGTKAKPNYIFHTIAGLKENVPPTKPWDYKSPMIVDRCLKGGGAVNTGAVYQELSIRSKGLRFPICEYASFDAVFKEVAKGIISGSKIECAFQVPPAPEGQNIDFDTLVVEYTPSNGNPVETLGKVFSINDCTPDSFYLDGNGDIALCPDACSRVQTDLQAKMRVVFDCLSNVM